MNKNQHTEPDTWISQKACGCLSMAIVNSPDRQKVVAKEVAKAIRLGETVTRVPTQQVREMEWKCPEHKARRDSNPLVWCYEFKRLDAQEEAK